jgi:cytochrome c
MRARTFIKGSPALPTSGFPVFLNPLHRSRFMRTLSSLGLVAAVAMAFSAGAYAAVDAEAAQALAKKNECTKCHSVDKDKKGPSFKKIAAKYKGKADGEEKVTKNLTTSPKVKLDDGTEEEHKAIKTKDAAELKNLVTWILSQ